MQWTHLMCGYVVYGRLHTQPSWHHLNQVCCTDELGFKSTEYSEEELGYLWPAEEVNGW